MCDVPKGSRTLVVTAGWLAYVMVWGGGVGCPGFWEQHPPTLENMTSPPPREDNWSQEVPCGVNVYSPEKAILKWLGGEDVAPTVSLHCFLFHFVPFPRVAHQECQQLSPSDENIANQEIKTMSRDWAEWLRWKENGSNAKNKWKMANVPWQKLQKNYVITSLCFSFLCRLCVLFLWPFFFLWLPCTSAGSSHAQLPTQSSIFVFGGTSSTKTHILVKL